jgi:hypothetical protein
VDTKKLHFYCKVPIDSSSVCIRILSVGLHDWNKQCGGNLTRNFDVHEVKKEGEEFYFINDIGCVSVGHEPRSSVHLFPQYLMSRHYLIMPLLSISVRNLKYSCLAL